MYIGLKFYQEYSHSSFHVVFSYRKLQHPLIHNPIVKTHIYLYFLIYHDILGNKDKYEFLQWDCELGDAVVFDMRTLHGSLNESIPDKTLSRYTLRVSKEDAKISYDGDWTSFNYRKAMQEAGYKNGDPVEGEMFPTLYEALD